MRKRLFLLVCTCFLLCLGSKIGFSVLSTSSLSLTGCHETVLCLHSASLWTQVDRVKLVIMEVLTSPSPVEIMISICRSFCFYCCCVFYSNSSAASVTLTLNIVCPLAICFMPFVSIMLRMIDFVIVFKLFSEIKKSLVLNLFSFNVIII